MFRYDCSLVVSGSWLRTCSSGEPVAIICTCRFEVEVEAEASILGVVDEVDKPVAVIEPVLAKLDV